MRATLVTVAALTVLAPLALAGDASGSAEPSTRPGGPARPASGERGGAITDVPGVRVGQYERRGDGYLTGTTVVHAPERAVGGVDVAGGAPGTRETDLLDPRNRVQRLDAVVLTGGSAYGLVAASGVMRWLEEQRQGFSVGPEPSRVVPIVPGAVIFDLGRGGRFTARPDAEFGYRAIAAAAAGPVRQGVHGAGAGAVAGGLKAGVGTASVRLDDGTVVGALVVVNSAGSTVDPDTCTFYAAFLERNNEFGGLRPPKRDECRPASGEEGPEQEMNTTLAVVATDAPLDKAQANTMAGTAHDGIARAIRPVHTLYDGDTVFALSTGGGQPWTVAEDLPRLNAVHAAAADTVGRAIVHAMLSAGSVGDHRSYCDTYPSACPGS